MHNYKLMKDNETMLVNSTFLDEDDFKYVDKHRFNVKFTETSCSSFAKYILKFQNMRYQFELRTEPDIAPDGTKLEDKIYAYFTHPENIISNDICKIENDERKIITEILNYLICLSRLVSPAQAKTYFGFKYDARIMELFREIKNSFSINKLNVNRIQNSDCFNQLVKELNEWEDNHNE